MAKLAEKETRARLKPLTAPSYCQVQAIARTRLLPDPGYHQVQAIARPKQLLVPGPEMKHEGESKRKRGLQRLVKNILSKRGLTGEILVLYDRLGKIGRQVMNNTNRIFSGRTIASEDIEIIKCACSKYSEIPRTELAATICELIGWATPAGNAKQVQCVRLFKEPEAEGVIHLLPLDTRHQRKCVVR
ncbi:MAG: hypothetical protein GX754_12030 [Clostridiaceae bacterium]|nr:hypothetical protein [Clostridiaceae bacterium]